MSKGKEVESEAVEVPEFKVSSDILNEVVAYMASKPYSEVNVLIGKLINGSTPIEKEAEGK